MYRVSGITVFRCNTTTLARLVQTSAVNVGDYAFVGDNPIGMAHTSDGRFTYVNERAGIIDRRVTGFSRCEGR